MSQIEEPGFPQFAPLATPLVKHLLQYQEIPFTSDPLLSFRTRVEQFSEHVHACWSLFEQRVREKRQHTYAIMMPALQKDETKEVAYVLPGWLRETLSKLMPPSPKIRKKEMITAQTLSTWSERHLVRHRAWGQLEVQSVAGIITARQLDETRERSWLPSMMNADEPAWWCYSQELSADETESPVVPRPVPLPDLPASTLFWTPWVGAAWDPCWLHIDTLGAIRWAGTHIDDEGKVQWGVSFADLERWDPEIGSLEMGFLKHSREMLDALAQVVLLRLALTRLQPEGALPPVTLQKEKQFGERKLTVR